MNKPHSLALGIVLLAGCGGSGGSMPAAQRSAPQTKTAQGSVIISIPAPAATTAQSLARDVKYPQFVSPNASSVALSINGGNDTFFDVSATSSLCTATAGVRNCTLSFGAPAGSDSFDFLIFQGANGTGAVLASTASTQTITAGTAFDFTVALNAVIGTVVANVTTSGTNPGGCPNSPASFNGINEGCSGSVPATFTVTDPSGAAVTGTAPYAATLALSTNDPTLTVSPAQITAPGQTATFSYSGLPLGAAITNSATVSITIGTNVIPVTIPVRRSYLYVANSNAPFGTTPDGGGNIAVYTYGASGPATPARIITGGATLLNNPVQPVLDSSGNLWVLDNGPYTVNSNPVINRYAPGATGNAAPTLQINQISAIDAQHACESMTFDPTFTYLLITCDDNAIHILTAPPPATTSVTAATLERNSVQDTAWVGPPVGMAFDANGNIYVAATANDAIEQYVFSAFPTSGSYASLAGAQGHVIAQGPGVLPSPPNAPLAVLLDFNGTLYSTISYPSASPGAADANNEIAIWNTSVIPCPGCAPTATLLNGPLTMHAPAGLAVDPEGELYVSNPVTNQINVVSRTTILGAGVGSTALAVRTLTTAASGSTAPTGMTVGP